MKNLRDDNDAKWLVIGDSNVVSCQEEKAGGLPFNPTDANSFFDFVDSRGLIDMPIVGGAYTWSNQRSDNEAILEKLDRVLCSTSWNIAFPKAVVMLDIPMGSDHVPVVIYPLGLVKKGKKDFKFESKWFLEEDCTPTVKGCWERVSQPRLSHRFGNKRSWDKHKLNSLFSDDEVKAILSIPIGGPVTKDSLVWPATKDGCYYVRSGYWFLCEKQVPIVVTSSSDALSDNKAVWRSIWNLNVPPRYGPFCGGCAITLFLPKVSLLAASMERFERLTATQGGLESLRIQLLAFASGFSWLWNSFVFEGITDSPEEVWLRTEAAFQEFTNAQAKKGPRVPIVQTENPSWTPPLEGCFKVCCDASFDKKTGKAAAAAVVCNSQGEIVAGDSDCFFASSASSAEASAIRLGVFLALSGGFCNVTFESDCKDVVYRIVSGVQSAWESAAVEEDILSRTSSLASFSFSFIPRSCNKVADWVARNTLRGLCPLSWAIHPPPDLVSLL
ncbi:hypothetical protein GQ457_04G024660 [Hibiscus cannabinus]